MTTTVASRQRTASPNASTPGTPAIPSIPRRELPAPSPSGRFLNRNVFPSLPPAPVLRAALWLRRALLALADRVVPPHAAVFDHSIGIAKTMMLGVAARHGFADLLAYGPLTADELASRTGTNADIVHRVLRGLALLGVFRLGADGRFRNNHVSRALRSGDATRTREWLQYFSSQSNVTAWCDLPRTVEAGGSAFERVFGESVWDWFERYPDEREMFAHAMTGLTVGDAPVLAKLYPFHEIKTVCDVGGGRGVLLSELLLRHPHLSGVLCDAEGVLTSAKEVLRARGVEDRATLVPGSFFAEVPKGSEAYILKNVLHDWDDARSLTILASVRRAMTPGQRVIIAETLLEKNDTSGFGPLSDLQMMVVCDGGRERSAAEIQELLRGSSFAPGRVFPFPTTSIVEGIAV